jgi:hypothetical protein
MEVIWLAVCIKILFILTMNHHHGKSASFRIGAKFELLSRPLQASFRFFRVPLPSKPSSTLRLSTPYIINGELIGLTLFSDLANSRYLRAALYPGVRSSVCQGIQIVPRPELVPFGPSVGTIRHTYGWYTQPYFTCSN